MLGNVLKSVELSLDKENIFFIFQDGLKVSGDVEGDCCSNSWIEHLELPDNVDGAKIISIYESDPVTNDREGDSYEVIKVYSISFKTDKGEIILEFRNSSNGYYGGWLNLCEVDKK